MCETGEQSHHQHHYSNLCFSCYYTISKCKKTKKLSPFIQSCIQEIIYLANGEQNASRGPSKFIVPDSRTVRPGRNFTLFGFGVSCVCTNMVLPLNTHNTKNRNKTSAIITQVSPTQQSHKYTAEIQTWNNPMGVLWPYVWDADVVWKPV